MEKSKKACKMILAKIFEAPISGTCRKVSYNPVANPNPTDSPFANSPGGQAMQNENMGSMKNPLSAGSLYLFQFYI